MTTILIPLSEYGAFLVELAFRDILFNAFSVVIAAVSLWQGSRKMTGK